ncbi:MAG: patatin family protein [Firmicutes bacterium]|nr:patatin family protein [Bacillota bacterium]
MIGIIDTGGGMRGVYGAGVTDYCIEKGIEFDYCIGVSAGAANMVTYIAGQRGRCFDFYVEYAFRKEYMSLRELIKNKNYVNLDYIYGTLSNSDGENPLDYPAVAASDKQLCVVATDAYTGKAVYFTKDDMAQDNYDIIKASCCVPVANRPYVIGENRYFDGALSDPVPIQKAFDEGCSKVVLILTRPRDFYRPAKRDDRLARFIRRKYPEAAKGMAGRYKRYNLCLDLAKELEKEGRLLIVAPDNIGKSKTLTRDEDTQILLYYKGLRDAAAIEDFISR